MAALSVVLYHYTYLGINTRTISSIEFIPYLSEFGKYGYLGVEFFFMISGYVIFYSAQDTKASSFAVARLLRLYPAFLCALLLTTLTILVCDMQQHKIYASQLLFNLTMIPETFGRNPIDGSYWTLSLEIQFYALIFIILLLRLEKNLNVLFLTWPTLILLASFIGGKDWPILGGYYSYFAVGSLFAMKRVKDNWLINFLIILCFYLSVNFSAGSHLGKEALNHLSPAVISLIISTFYLFFLFLTNEKACALSLPKAKSIGAITYPLYLTHQVIGYTIISKFSTDQNKASIIACTIIFFLIIAFIINKYIERDLKYFWRTLFDRLLGAPIRKIETHILNVVPKS
ncbi:acyltransferase|nr:acyltransferase [Noviherbaspirillum sp. L7-7A]